MRGNLPAEEIITPVEGGVSFRIKVQPKASRNEACEIRDGVLKVRLTAPPVDGAANAACVEFFAEIMDIPRRFVRIASGEKSRQKLVHIEGMTPAAAAAALDRAISSRS